MLSLADNPLPRWPEGRALVDDVGRWWVARVKPRQEKVLALELAAVGVAYYLPMLLQRKTRRDNGKIRKSLVCAFPGYLPVVGYPERRLEILRTSRVLRVIEVREQAQFVRELESVRLALDVAAAVAIEPRLAVGRRATVLSGPLKGVEGIVLDRFGRDSLCLNVGMFQRAIVVAISPDQVRLEPD